MAGLARLDTEAFERDDQHDRASAFNTFKGNRDGCVYQMMQSMRPYKGGVEWKLRTYPPWLLAYPAEAIFFDRWAEELQKQLAQAKARPPEEEGREQRTRVSYTADELRALRASPYASVPPRPMAVVPGVVLSEKK